MTASAVVSEHDADEAEWRELAQERHAAFFGKLRACGIPHIARPHPQSYRPDLPLRGMAGLWTITKEERKALAKRPMIVTIFTSKGKADVAREEKAAAEFVLQSARTGRKVRNADAYRLRQAQDKLARAVGVYQYAAKMNFRVVEV